MGGRGSSLGKGNRPPATSSGSTGSGPARVEPAVPATEQPRPEPDGPEDTQPQPDPAAAPEPSIEDRIRAAVATLTANGNGWAGIVDIRNALADVDQTEVTQALRDMARDNPNIHLAPESNRKALTDDAHAAAVTVGGEQQHIIAIQPVQDPAALRRVQAAGLANATDKDLEAARVHHGTPSSIYDQIRAEQKRRAQE
ncbi:hypothetical protein DMH03_23865 [Amycolatopsis sp. WAC 01376]|uniref:hypothetical protein n=1 Tax=Amycolatopsis sp. WAC 01376 TaxID=2203195 RepID=UPI000F7A8F53|nr:hypothetical protein [Amycolatopsis sp. WAC 01376]RSM58940.1 hypothetical protein DMH03_23865 [Amycolatopsis sp. WAC 01376]